MKFIDINTPVKGNGWFKLKVKDKTKRTLKNGAVISSWSAMTREAHKSGK